MTDAAHDDRPDPADGPALPDARGLGVAAAVRLLTGRDAWRTWDEPALGLRSMVLSDGPVGVRGQTWDERDPSACLPSPTCLGATWDPALAARYGAVLAAEARRKGVDVVLGPTVNLHRSPLGGRHFEAFSEDPLLTAAIGTGYVRGVQAGGVGATPKHYVANDSETARFTVDALVDDRTLHEVYLAPFDALVAAGGAWLVMAAYNAVNGPTMTENPLLTDPLRTRWGFDGVLVSDWTAVRSTVAAALADTDLAMPGPGGPWGDALVAAVEAGAVPRAAVDRGVERIVRLAGRVGALDGVPPAVPQPPGAPDATAVAREVAAAGSVLLTNRAGVLPVASAAGGAAPTVAVIGRSAVEPRIQGGGSATVFPAQQVGPADGIRARFGDDAVRVHRGVPVQDGPTGPALDLLADPETGDPGVRVRLTGAGGVVRDEYRRTGRLVAFGDPGLEEARELTMSTRYTPVATGTHRVGVRASGPVRLSVDGDVLLDAAAHQTSDDPGGGLLEPQVLFESADLVAGRAVELVATMVLAEDQNNALLEFVVDEPQADLDDLLADAAAVAAGADVAVVVVGTTEQDESEGYDRSSLALPGRQDDLVRAVARANPRTVVVVNAGAPVLLPWRDEVAAVLLTWFGGQEYGSALADVLSGDREPGGRLPTTWPAAEVDCPVLSTTPRADGTLPYDEGVHVGYRGWLRSRADGGAAPAFPFGHGLGYTSWALDDIDVPQSIAPDGPTAVTVAVRNTGERPGRDVVQVYLGRAESAVDRPLRWLAGFTAVDAAPGQTVRAVVEVPRRAFQHWDVAAADGAGDWVLEPGAFRVSAGHSVLDLPLAGAIRA